MKKIFIQLCGLLLINEAGYWIEKVTHLPLPGNVIGMLLFLLLITKIIPVHWIEGATSLLMKHLAFFSFQLLWD
ncbi:CidA/LrgA family protein [Paenibacillus sp. J2TS4]|uniref:CidA/LrgA family protein n=1 Tax=Paenibacillus sp. J2TS4 TaxID=2807194 RepID=UPI001AFD43B5|nr:CidA/LrgA family protein [Paenibacillus sp. J2TS4]GIP36604.1 hypothetical protein J2TS4_58140 [Paenibacillus sp. J2TS4]